MSPGEAFSHEATLQGTQNNADAYNKEKEKGGEGIGINSK